MGQSRPLFVYFRYLLITISIIQIEKKRRWCAWDSNLGPQNGKRRQNHGAMAATSFELLFTNDILQKEICHCHNFRDFYPSLPLI